MSVLTSFVCRDSDKNDAKSQSNQPWEVRLTIATADGHADISIACHGPVTSKNHFNISQGFTSLL